MRLIILAIFLLTSSTVFGDETSTLERRPEYSIAVTDITGLEELKRDFQKFVDTLEKSSGFKIKFFPVSSRTVVVEALNRKKVDFVLTGPSEYVVLNTKTNAKPLVRFSRPDYYSAIVTLASSGITQAKQLKGKKIAFGDVGSTSYHLAPMQLLSDVGIDPRDDIKAINVSRHLGWKALKRGDVQALGIKHEMFAIFRSAEKELEPAHFRVVLRGPDLPDDVLVAGSHVSEDACAKLTKAFSDNSKELVKAILVGEGNKKYKGMKFIAGVKDSDYDYIRKMYKTIGYPEFAVFH